MEPKHRQEYAVWILVPIASIAILHAIMVRGYRRKAYVLSAALLVAALTNSKAWAFAHMACHGRLNAASNPADIEDTKDFVYDAVSWRRGVRNAYLVIVLVTLVLRRRPGHRAPLTPPPPHRICEAVKAVKAVKAVRSIRNGNVSHMYGDVSGDLVLGDRTTVFNRTPARTSEEWSRYDDAAAQLLAR